MIKVVLMGAAVAAFDDVEGGDFGQDDLQEA